MLQSTYLKTDFGTWKITGSSMGLREVKWVEPDTVPEVQATGTLPEVLEEARDQLAGYFAGKRTAFDLKLDLSGHTEFYQSVWKVLVQVPFGRTTSYLAIPKQLGDPNSVRAVGQANRNNPIAIVIPCHRCIAQNGDLQGYFYGLDFKKRLLALENPTSFAEQGSLF